jgi:hypothetical protein
LPSSAWTCSSTAWWPSNPWATSTSRPSATRSRRTCLTHATPC